MGVYKRSEEVEEMAVEVMQEHFPDLVGQNIRVACVEYWDAQEPDSQALQHGGYSAAATVETVADKHRALGHADALITVDRHTWQTSTDRQRQALLHHELTHLELVRDKFVQVKRNANGRVKLTLRKHDVQMGWFERTAEIFGPDSFEVLQARRVTERCGQSVFAFLDEQIEAEAGKRAAVADLLVAQAAKPAKSKPTKVKVERVTKGARKAKGNVEQADTPDQPGATV